jgi:ABC-type nitrate/sulfonate/bicarbonate transport system substrate-binding protein
MKLYDQGEQLKRIADALELVIQMVKKDQEETRARFEERWDEPKNDLPDNINGRPYKGRL